VRSSTVYLARLFLLCPIALLLMINLGTVLMSRTNYKPYHDWMYNRESQCGAIILTAGLLMLTPWVAMPAAGRLRIGLTIGVSAVGAFLSLLGLVAVFVTVVRLGEPLDGQMLVDAPNGGVVGLVVNALAYFVLAWGRVETRHSVRP